MALIEKGTGDYLSWRNGSMGLRQPAVRRGRGCLQGGGVSLQKQRVNLQVVSLAGLNNQIILLPLLFTSYTGW